jgi:hypothetical protein
VPLRGFPLKGGRHLLDAPCERGGARGGAVISAMGNAADNYWYVFVLVLNVFGIEYSKP